MTMLSSTRVVAVEKLCGGVVITFDDGLSAAYSADLLRSVLRRSIEKETPAFDLALQSEGAASGV